MSETTGDVQHDFLPPGDALRKAVRWISDQRSDDPRASLANLIEEAALRFDLTTEESEFLFSAFLPGRSPKEA